MKACASFTHSCQSCAATWMLMLNPVTASEYPITVGSFFTPALIKSRKLYYVIVLSSYRREHSILCRSIYHQKQIWWHMGTWCCFLCKDLKSNHNSGCIHLYLRPTVTYVSAYYFSVSTRLIELNFGEP